MQTIIFVMINVNVYEERRNKSRYLSTQKLFSFIFIIIHFWFRHFDRLRIFILGIVFLIIILIIAIKYSGWIKLSHVMTTKEIMLRIKLSSRLISLRKEIESIYSDISKLLIYRFSIEERVFTGNIAKY
jgi:hypothetical protein